MGGFYRYGIPRPAHCFDKYPVDEAVRQLEDAELLPDNSFKSIVIDLPFIVDEYVDSKEVRSMMQKRFSHFSSNEELYRTNSAMLSLAYRLLIANGVLVMKTQDYWYKGKQEWVALYVIEEARKLGFELLDQFLLIAKTKLLKQSYRQRCARKMHSYFLVFRKI